MKTGIKRTLVVAGTAATLGIAGISSLGIASAATNQSTSNGASSLITKLADKFNLKKEDVQAVFDEDRTAHQAEHQQRLEERLSQAVKDGKITESQKAKIIAKLAELKAERQANRDAWKSKTPAERRAAVKELRAEIKKWADDNDVPLRYLMFMHGPGPHHGPMDDVGDDSEDS